MDLNSYFRIVRRRWTLVLLTIIVGVVAAVAATPADSGEAVEYTATHRMILQPTRGDAGELVSPGDQTVQRVVAFLGSRQLAERVANKLSFPGDPSALSRRVSAQTTNGSVTLGISATDPQPGPAVALADTYARELIAFLDEQAAQTQQTIRDDARRRMDELQAQIRQLDARIGRDTTASVLSTQRAALAAEYDRAFQQYQRATNNPGKSGLVSLEPAVARKAGGFEAPRTRAGRGALAAGLGLGLGIALALIVERVDRRIRTKEAAEQAFGLPVLAEVPPMRLASRRKDQVLTAEQPSSIVAEAYRNLRTSLTLMGAPAHGEAAEDGGQPPVHTILVSSANPGEGKTTTATNLAAAFAEAGQEVLVLDCDFRHPRAGRYLGVGDGPGLSDALGGRSGVRLADVVVASDIPGVSVVTSGSPVPNPAELFARGHHVLRSATELADVVIFDTPPMLAINDASELLPLVDTVVLTCRSGRTTIDAAERVRDLLARLGGPVTGIVLVGSTEAPTSRGHYYYYADNPKELPLWRRLTGGGSGRAPRQRSTRERSGARPAPASPQTRSPAKGNKGKRGKKDRRPAQDGRPKPPLPPTPGPPPAPRQAAPAPQPRPAAPAAPVAPQPSRPQPQPHTQTAPPPPRQAPPAPAPAPAPDAAFAPPPSYAGAPDPTALEPDAIALGDPDQPSLDAATPEDASPAPTPPSTR